MDLRKGGSNNSNGGSLHSSLLYLCIPNRITIFYKHLTMLMDPGVFSQTKKIAYLVRVHSFYFISFYSCSLHYLRTILPIWSVTFLTYTRKAVLGVEFLGQRALVIS